MKISLILALLAVIAFTGCDRRNETSAVGTPNDYSTNLNSLRNNLNTNLTNNLPAR